MRFFSVLTLLLSASSVAAQDFCRMCDSGSPANSDLVIPFLAIANNDNPTCSQVNEFGINEVSASDETCSLIKAHKDFCGCSNAATQPLNLCSVCADGSLPVNYNAATPFNDTCGELDSYLRFLPSDLCSTDRVGNIKKVDAFCGCPGVVAACYMCDDDTNKLSNPERLIPFFEFLGNSFSSTCQDLADFYTLYDSNDPEISTCEFVKLEADYCGCATADTSPVNACGLCGTDSVLDFPDRVIQDLNMTCSQLAAYMSYVSADDCSMPWVTDLQRFDFYCGCSGATAPCPICSDGSINVSRPEAVIPYLIIPNNENPTCSQLAMLGVISEPGELVLDNCTIFDLQSNFCGCPDSSRPTNGCKFCPGGTAPPNPDLVTPFGDTCGELSNYLSYLPSEECSSERVSFMQRQDFLCGCKAATTACALCARDGSNAVTYPNRPIPLLSLPLNTNPTCTEVIQFMAINDGDLSDSGCSALQGYAGYCGCPSTTPVNACSFCTNGGTPSNPDKVVSEIFTCQELYDFVSFLPSAGCNGGSKDFAQIQAFGYTCGCPNVQPSCSLCPGDQSPSQPDVLLADNVTTCAEFAELVVTLTADQCTQQSEDIAAAASICGCPSSSSSGGSGSGQQCALQQNKQLCTTELLASTTEVCECYAFCDSTFVKCESADGGLLLTSECAGTPITGCNLASLNTSPTTTEASTGGSKDNTTAIIVSAIVVPVVLLLFVGIYYAHTRKSKAEADKMNAELEAQSEMSAPVMDGSFSMSDVNTDIQPPPYSPTSLTGSMATSETPVEDLNAVEDLDPTEPKIV